MAGAACGTPIDYFTPLGDPGRVLCDLPPSHDGEHDCGELFLRPADTPRFLVDVLWPA